MRFHVLGLEILFYGPQLHIWRDSSSWKSLADHNYIFGAIQKLQKHYEEIGRPKPVGDCSEIVERYLIQKKKHEKKK
jgi:hypothetical protein